MKATVDMADLLGLHLVMSRNAGKGEYKIMVAAMGWATAELIMSRYSDHPERYAVNHNHDRLSLAVTSRNERIWFGYALLFKMLMSKFKKWSVLLKKYLFILNRCIPLWVGARGIEFDWKYIQMSFDSNISLVRYVLSLCCSFRVCMHQKPSITNMDPRPQNHS